LLVALSGYGPTAAAAPPAQAAPPDILAKAAIVVEYPSGRILYSKNMHERLPEASTTKTMTALVVLQRVSVTDVVTATADDLVGESSMGLVAGETQTVGDMLYGLMLPSGNDAAMALARYVGGGLKDPGNAPPVARFVALMNRQATQMGLSDTHFTNPHGLDDPAHYTTAYDLASITWDDLHNPVFDQIVSQVFHNVPDHHLINTNEMLTRYPGADGVKTGMTDSAGNCLITSATRNGRRLIAVVLGEQYGHTYPDSGAILDYGFAQQADNTTEALTVARRSEVLWFLAAALPPPLPTPRATAAPADPANTGNLNPGGLLSSSHTPAVVVSAATGSPPLPPADTSAWVWPVGAALFGGLLLALLLYGLPRRRVAAVAIAPAAPPLPPSRITLAAGDDLRTRAERAVALAYRGQEGSSLAEFLMVVKQQPDYEFGNVPGFYDMPAPGYLALARAYAECSQPRYAAALLKLGLDAHQDDPSLARLLSEVQTASGSG